MPERLFLEDWQSFHPGTEGLFLEVCQSTVSIPGTERLLLQNWTSIEPHCRKTVPLRQGVYLAPVQTVPLRLGVYLSRVYGWFVCVAELVYPQEPGSQRCGINGESYTSFIVFSSSSLPLPADF